MKQFYRSKGIKEWHLVAAALVIYDIVTIVFSYTITMFLRYDFMYSYIPQTFLNSLKIVIPINVILSVIIYFKFNLYRSMWRFASVFELFRIMTAVLVSFILHTLIIAIFFKRMPIVYYALGGLLQFAFAALGRFSHRAYLVFFSKRDNLTSEEETKNAMIIGAGDAGQLILSDINKSASKYNVKCFIDDNPNKWSRFINSVPVVGGRDKIIEVAKTYNIDTILLAIPSGTPKEINEILEICKETGCELKKLPGIYQLVTGEVTVETLKDVEIEDLLGRDSINVLNPKDFKYIVGKTILVTGGGGSIGSELCRQIAEHSPNQLIIFDIYENNAYEIEQELKRCKPELNLKVLIGSVREIERLKEIFDEFKPDIVYHAAAHKHVPLMETSPYEAIKNNVFGTFNVAICALISNTQRFILISTDKAVNPTNIMGATKRMCEMVIQTMDKVSKTGEIEILQDKIMTYPEEIRKILNSHKGKEFETDFVAVRFGNVLGSNGSVIPLFRNQIKEGGPVTVTHPDIIRYFMTISEAVSLVLQAGNMASGGEIFVLDMGAPVKIDTLARNLIKLSGLEPDKDIKIVYSGLRPGEKLYEEKLMSEEGLKSTDNDLIHIGQPIEFDSIKFIEQISKLQNLSNNDLETLHRVVKDIVPTYHSPESDIEANKEKFDELYSEAK